MKLRDDIYTLWESFLCLEKEEGNTFRVIKDKYGAVKGRKVEVISRKGRLLLKEIVAN